MSAQLDTLIADAQVTAARLTEILDRIEAKLPDPAPVTRYFRAGRTIWKLKPGGGMRVRNVIKPEWVDAHSTLETLQLAGAHEITAEEGEP